jgi:hypothetical protein
MNDRTEALFSYGTLQLDHVQQSLFGRRLAGQADTLCGYTVGTIEIRDPDAVAASGVVTHLALRAATDVPAINGILYDLSPAELAAADEYEGGDYRRICVTFGSGRRGWVYIAT